MRERALALGLGVSLAVHVAVLSIKGKDVTDAPMAPASLVVHFAEQRVETPAPRKTPRKAQPAPVPAQPELPPATTVGQYRYLLAAAAARYNAYPADAHGGEGDAVVRIGVRGGSIEEVTLARSSGHAALDEQALHAFGRAAREVPVPPALWGREFGVELSASYRADAVR
jgi:periplasmic protein TonB